MHKEGDFNIILFFINFFTIHIFKKLMYNQIVEILKIENLNLGFLIKNEFYQVLHDINLIINKGETFAVVGESGCGKSMTAMSIINLLPKNAKITSGKIFFNGQDLLELPKKEIQKIRGRRISLISQDPMTSLNPLYTVKEQVREVVEMNSDLRGKDVDKRITELFDMVKIPNAKNRLNNYPHEFSGGMKQRVIISMALAANAELIIADEPTTALDFTVQLQIMDLLEEIKKEINTSVLLISHDLGLVANYSQNCAVMYSGHIVETASTKELVKNPKHPYTEALINSLPNFENNTITSIDGQPPSIYEKIEGCSFNPRCRYALKECFETFPASKEVNENHYIKCFVK